MDADYFQELLSQSRAGDRAALGHLLEEFRPYLVLLARRQFDPRLRSRADPMDLVQISFLEAYRDIDRFRGSTFGEMAAWLRTMLQRNVLQSHERHLDAERRSVKREQTTPTGSAQHRVLASLMAEQSSPSRRALRGEEAVELAAAIGTLPEDQAEAIRLRHLEGWSLKQMATYLDRSEMAVAGLVKRGLQKLRATLKRSEEPDKPE